MDDQMGAAYEVLANDARALLKKHRMLPDDAAVDAITGPSAIYEAYCLFRGAVELTDCGRKNGAPPRV